jgi:hypothetical protein
LTEIQISYQLYQVYQWHFGDTNMQNYCTPMFKDTESEIRINSRTNKPHLHLDTLCVLDVLPQISISSVCEEKCLEGRLFSVSA